MAAAKLTQEQQNNIKELRDLVNNMQQFGVPMPKTVTRLNYLAKAIEVERDVFQAYDETLKAGRQETANLMALCETASDSMDQELCKLKYGNYYVHNLKYTIAPQVKNSMVRTLIRRLLGQAGEKGFLRMVKPHRP
jgi:hypothetical protein